LKYEQLQNQLRVLISKYVTSVDLDRPHEVVIKDGRLKV
jgi:hypothetical protein